MADTDDEIPVLTDAIEGLPPASAGLSSDELERLEARLCATSLRLAEESLRDACREAEHVVTKRVMDALRAELPAIVSRTLREHFDK